MDDNHGGASRPLLLAAVVLGGAAAGPVLAQDAPASAHTIAAGERHTCAIDAHARVLCWGSGRDGQLGRPGGSRYTPPAEVPGLPPVTSIAATHGRTCAIARSGSVICWGRTRSPTRDVPVHPPTQVPGLSDVGAIAIGRYLGCALTRSGRVSCWGDGENGGLGDGATEVRAEARELVSVSGATAIAVGPAHGCAALASGAVVCWGSNDHGQLGDGTGRDASAPVTVPGVRDVVQLVASGRQTCARSRAGRVVCWGTNPATLSRQIRGRGPWATLAVLLARQPGSRWTVRGLPPARDLAVHGLGLCATDAAGLVRCGLSPRAGSVVAGLRGVTEVAMGEGHACARLADHEVRCWGNNRDGQTGDGVVGSLATRPSEVSGLDDVVGVDASLGRSCASRANGEVVCWSGARHGDTRPRGQGPGAEWTLPPARSRWTRFASNGRELCGVNTRGALECVRRDPDQAPTRWARRTLARTGVEQVVATWSAMFVRTADGIACVREGEAALRAVPIAGPVVELVAAADRACARLGDGRVLCTAASPDRGGAEGSECGAEPVAQDALRGAGRIAVADDGRVCALFSTGDVRCVGPSRDDTAPLDRVGVGEAVTLVLGHAHGCALRASGRVTCWGANDRGQLGLGHTDAAGATGDVVGLDDALELVADDDTTCARRRTGGVVCWGDHDPSARSSLGWVTPVPMRVPLDE